MKPFDRFADHVERWVAKAPFFIFCLALVVAWLVMAPFQGWGNQLWHLALNSPTTSITFLLVALLQNSQRRFENTTNKKLNALADALARTLDDEPAQELREAVGIEERTSA